MENRCLKEESVEVGGITTEYLVSGDGPPLVLLHSDGDSAASWRWVIPALARSHRVYAPSYSGFGGSDKPQSDYSPQFFVEFLTGFLDALDIDRPSLVGNSLGGVVAMQFALASPGRVSTLALVDSAGLGREIHPALVFLTTPGIGDAAIAWSKTPIGAAQRAFSRAALLFARYDRVPSDWLREQYRLAQTPGFLDATLASLRAVVDARGQRCVLLDELPKLDMPTLVMWGANDLVVPAQQARNAAALLPRGRLTVIPDCGHMPEVELPDRFVAELDRFLAESSV